MSQRRILRREGGSLSVAAESWFTSEEELHTAIASHPEVLPSEDVGLGPLVPLGSELDLGHGPIDLLSADGGGRPVIVEFKRGSENPDVRKVVAQVLDYGASLWRVDYDDLEQKCARCQPSFDGPLVDHVRERLELVGETSFDADAFRRGFEDALDAGDFVFLYVGRDLDARTKRIMTFLAEGPRMKFFAVEVDYFVDEETAVLVPRTAFVPSWAGAGSRETRDKAVTPIQERIDAAPRAVGELVVLMDRFAEEFGLIADYGENSRMYRPAPRKQGIAIYPAWANADFYLKSLRDRGQDDLADEIKGRLEALAGKPVTPVLAGVGCEVLVANWEEARATILEPYFQARLAHYES